MASRRSSRSDRPPLGAGWALWPSVLLRGAGFSFSWLDQVMHAPGSDALRGVAADPTFREAVTWQNRAAVEGGLDSLLRRPHDATDAKTRKKELMVVRYLQRYCAKNDTIGFFGPVGWASWSSGPGRFEPSATLLDSRRTSLEPWAARVLADAVSALPENRKTLWASLPGDLRVDERGLLSPTVREAVSTESARLLKRLQARGTMLATKLLGARGDWSLLEALARRGIVRLGWPVAIAHQPLARLPRVPPVIELEQRLANVQAAAGTPALTEALSSLDAAFTHATAHAPTRHPGRTYGARGLVYEDCRRTLDLSLSSAMLAQVSVPLRAVLTIARWYTWRISTALSRSLRARVKEKSVPLHVFWAQTADLFDGEVPPVVTAVKAELSYALARFAGRELSPRAQAAFAAPCPGWPGARHHSPDLMWSAASAEAMLRGEGTPVLGELHPGVNTFTTLSVLGNAPNRRQLELQWQRDFPRPTISPIPWEDFARSSHDARLATDHWHLDLGFEFDSERPRSRVLRAADFDVQPNGNALRAAHAGTGLRFDLWELFERRIRLNAAAAFSLSDGSATGPRRRLGELVIERAHWRFETSDLHWLDAPSHGARLERAQAFRDAHRLPQRVFLRSPTEMKPLYLDWSAPLLLEVLHRLCRQAPWLAFAEMLPDRDGLWLRDAAGAPYVCELRTIAVDPKPWSSRSVWPAISQRTRKER